jgi:hypothetical protein
MNNDPLNKSDGECKELLRYILEDAKEFYRQLAPKGLKHTELVLFLHPTPKQQLEEYIRISENLNKLTKKTETTEEEKSIEDFKQDDLTEIADYEEFLYILGLSIYDIFSNNHEVICADKKIYDFGSMRGSGRFIADFFNENLTENSKAYDYIDFYMGTIWIESRGNLIPIYEYIFQKLKHLGYDWKYSFPRLFLVDPQNISQTSDEDDLKSYKPKKSIEEQLELNEKKKQTKKLQEELDKIHDDAFEDAKYRPLDQVVQAYKNIYGHLPTGHPQKGFE